MTDPTSGPEAKLAPGAPPAAAPAIGWGSPSALVLVAANLVPLYGVIYLGWSVFPLVVLFWAENVVIGVLNALRMLLAQPGDPALWLKKLFMVPFFCAHYGMFTVGHGVFVFTAFGGEEYKRLIEGFWPTGAALHAIAKEGLAQPLALLAASHLFSFGWNYLWRGEYRRAGIDKLMSQPYARVIVLHITILSGSFAATMLGSPTWALVVLVGLKIAFDLGAHLKEHRKLAPKGAGDSGVSGPS